MYTFFKTTLLSVFVLGFLSIPAVLIIRRRGKNRNLALAAYVLALVFLSRLAVGACAAGAHRLEIEDLGPVERFFDSIVHTLQTFSMDEDYTEYLTAGKEALESAGHPTWAQVYGVTGSVLNVCAPILGGALLLEILAGIFPYLRVHLHPFRHKFVFSELNDASITLAEDFAREEHYRKYLGLGPMDRRPVLIFTDAYPDETSEPRSELFERAEAIHAICVKTDLLHLPMRRSGSVSYFLMDKKSGENINAIAKLLQKDESGRYLWPEAFRKKDASKAASGEKATKICIFTESDAENEMIWRAYRQMEKDSKKVLIRPIRDYMNTAVCLMYDVPLFLPLMGRKKQGDLHVTILGSGNFAEEVCKAVFWCGQISGVQLHIDILAENAGAFYRKLEDRCPELFDCSRVIAQESTREPAPGILAAFPDDSSGPENPPYCIFRFRDVDDPEVCLTYPDGVLEETDYFVIALGEDGRDLRVSGDIRKHIMRMEGCEDRGHVVIAPVVFSRDLSALARRVHPVGNEPYVLPFADLRSRFSYRNVQMDTFLANAEKDGALYDAAKQEEIEKDEYSHWANLSRSVHYPYKLFGLGLVEDIDVEQEGREKYRIRSPHAATPEEDEALAWMEHRRWNAFLRTQGFSCPSPEQFERYYRRNCAQGHPEVTKDVGLRFHPCLVERAMTATAAEHRDLDRLDLLGIRHGKDYKQFDYKEYDADLMKYLT